MSIGFMLPNPDDAVIWRGPRKNGLIKQSVGGAVPLRCPLLGRRPPGCMLLSQAAEAARLPCGCLVISCLYTCTAASTASSLRPFCLQAHPPCCACFAGSSRTCTGAPATIW